MVVESCKLNLRIHKRILTAQFIEFKNVNFYKKIGYILHVKVTGVHF